MKVFRAETAGDETYAEIAALLGAGAVVAFPTDTTYGLAADPFNETAVDRIFAIKGRPETKPILLLVDSVDMANSVIEGTDLFYRVAENFWPGPITIITAAGAEIPAKVTAGSGTIGVRWPLAPFATTLLKHFGKPITATSANLSGMPPTISADEVRGQLGDSVQGLVDGGVLSSRGASTVLDLTVVPPIVRREGPVTFEKLAEFFRGNIRRQIA